MSNRVLRVFWPIDVLRLERQNGYQASIVIGWKNSNSDLVVVTTLPFLEPSMVDMLLRQDDLFMGSKHPAPHIYKLCGSKRMCVLGTVNYDGGLSPEYTRLPMNAKFDDTMAYPVHQLKSHDSVQVITFDLPEPYRMQYYSLYPISLELSEKSNLTVISEEYEADLVEAKKQKQLLIEKIKYHSLTDRTALRQREVILKNCISQINCSYELGELMRKNASVVFPKIKSRRRRLSVSETVLESARTVHNGFWHVLDMFWDLLVPLTTRVLIVGIIFGRIFSEAVLRIIEWKMRPKWYALKDISATAQQIDLRLQQFCFWPIQYLKIRKRSKDWLSNTDFNVEYIRFYNSIWLVINDIIFGVAIGRLILDNSDWILNTLSFLVDEILTARFKSNMLWLMDWPGGLKLNNELAAFFGELFLWVIQFWGSLLHNFRPYFKLIIHLVGYSGYAGAAYPISIISDIISLLTFHIYCFYVASARIYHWQLVVLQSLFHLFRGKKRNVLRNRIDSCNYDLDQLLMGTIFFTVLIFLLPTVLVFYLTFATSRLAIVLICALCESSLACLNHFPLFAILLRVKDSKRIPGGIRLDFKIDQQQQKPPDWLTRGLSTLSGRRTNIDNSSATHSYVVLKPVPLGFGHMFHQYHILGERLRMHYLSFNVIKRLLTGQFVPIKRSKLYGLLYSMLPEQRIKVQLLYQELKELL